VSDAKNALQRIPKENKRIWILPYREETGRKEKPRGNVSTVENQFQNTVNVTALIAELRIKRKTTEEKMGLTDQSAQLTGCAISAEKKFEKGNCARIARLHAQIIFLKTQKKAYGI
jgi:hypothetical protein